MKMNINTKKGVFSARSFFFIIMILVLFCCVAYLLYGTRFKDLAKTALGKKMEYAQKQRQLANKLRGAGLLEESAQAYERYLEISDPPQGEWSKLSYTIGQIYIDAKEYEKALRWLYQVEIYDPDTTLSATVNPMIIKCLEKLGKHQAAEYALKARTSLDPAEKAQEAKGGKVIAQIGDEKVYLSDIDEIFDTLPPWLKKEFSDREKKREFAKHYIAEELLYRKGKKLDILSEPGVRKRIEQLTRQVVLEQIRKTEIEDKLVIDDTDVQNYYAANKDKYKDPNQDDVTPFEELKERVKQDYRMMKIQQGYQNLIKQSLSSTDVRLYLENIN